MAKVKTFSRWTPAHSTHVRMPVADLLPNPMQPPMRTSDKALKELEACQLETRFTATVVAVKTGAGAVMVDGHRRLFLAKRQGHDFISVDLLESGDPIQLFMLMNKGMKSLDGKHSFQGWAHCNSAQQQRIMKRMKSGLRSDINWLIEHLGYDWTVALGKRGSVSPHVAEQIKTVMAHVTSYRVPKPPSAMDVAQWIIGLGLQRYVREQEKQDFANRRKFEKVCGWIRNCEAPVSMRSNIGMEAKVAALKQQRKTSRTAARKRA